MTLRAQKNWESAFIHCAGIFLSCRLQTMGGSVPGKHWAKGRTDIMFALLGESDYAWEMELICQERLAESNGTVHSRTPVP